MIETGAFRGLIKLQFLDLADNELQEIRPDMWEGLPSLRKLNFFGNHLTSVPCGCFRHLINLDDELMFTRNPIPTLEPENFSELGKLPWLILRQMDLTVIRGDMWIGLKSLTYLDLYENQITIIERGGFTNLPMIEMINLRNNMLSTLSPDAFCLSTSPNPTVQLSKLKLLLDGIDLICNRSLCWLKVGEESEFFTLHEFDWADHPVECVNFPGVPWDEVVLDCVDVGMLTPYMNWLYFCKLCH